MSVEERKVFVDREDGGDIGNGGGGGDGDDDGGVDRGYDGDGAAQYLLFLVIVKRMMWKKVTISLFCGELLVC